jgi:hypothetical protein
VATLSITIARRREVRHRLRGGIAPIVAATVCLVAPSARASDVVMPDGVYGRLRGDTALSIEAGGGLAIAPDGARPNIEVTARARYLDMAGVFLSYDNAPGATRFDGLSLGIDLRPAMFARIFSDLEHGPRFLDLMLDSIGFDFGTAWMRPGDPWGNGSGFAWLFGGGIDLPLVWSNGSGLLLRLSVRWLHSTPWDPQRAGLDRGAGEGVLIDLSFVGRTTARLGLVGAP